MNRRGFLQSMLAAGVGAYLPRAESMMRIVVRDGPRWAVDVDLFQHVHQRVQAVMVDAGSIEQTCVVRAMIEQTCVVREMIDDSMLSIWRKEGGHSIGFRPDFSQVMEYSYKVPRLSLAAQPGLGDVVTVFADGKPYTGKIFRVDNTFVAEDVDLTPFGNRIPDWEFEVKT